jgi:hypothetical protein
LFQAQLTGREKHRAHDIATLRVQTDCAAATNRFVVRVRRDDEDFHSSKRQRWNCSRCEQSRSAERSESVANGSNSGLETTAARGRMAAARPFPTAGHRVTRFD